MTPPSSSDAGRPAHGAPVPLDPREVYSPDVAERLIDVMARMIVIAARVRAERAAAVAATDSHSQRAGRRSAAR